MGGEPVGAIVSNYEFTSKPQDVTLLQNVSKVSAAALRRAGFDQVLAGAETMTLGGTLEPIDRCRLRRPVVVFSYLNPILRYGLDRGSASGSAMCLGAAGTPATALSRTFTCKRSTAETFSARRLCD